MNIIVAGCGKIGTTIVESLVAEGHDVVAIDRDPTVVTELANILDVMCVCGNAADCDTLEEAGVSSAELFVAVTGSDEFNMLSCFLARKMGAAHTIARIRTPEYNDKSLQFLRQQLELSMSINPERLAAQELYHLLKLPSAVKVETFSRRSFEMVELRLKQDSPFCGSKLTDLRNKYKAMFLICVVRRGDQVVIPGGDFTLQAGDRVGLTASPAELQKLLKAMGVPQRNCKNVMILGGSKTAFYLAKMLASAGCSVKIIEQSHTKCQELSSTLGKDVMIINGDGAQQELLMEEGLLSQDAFVSLTGMDEENILLSFFAGAQRVPKVISKVNRDELATLAEQLGLDSIISPKRIIANILVRYARALQNSMNSSVETLYQLMDGSAEALEFIINGPSALTGVELKDLQLKNNILIAGILRERKPIIPAGNDMLLPGDRVVVIAAGHRITDLTDILR